MLLRQTWDISFRLLLVFFLSAPLIAVTVNPALCPTNKIAPHRRIGSWNPEYQPRTLGAFYELLAPGPGFNGNQQYDPNLVEEPQKDDPDDCGEIEDYDENDLSSLTPNYIRRDSFANGRLFFGLFDSGERPQYPQRPPQGYPQNPQTPQRPPQGYPNYPQNPQRPPPGYPEYPQNPQTPQRPPQYPQRPPQSSQQQGTRPPVRPPYGSGGYFGNNHYRPPIQHSPSESVKPVHDGNSEPQTTYRPHVVGGPIGHVVGVSPVPLRPPRPTRRPDRNTEAPNYQQYSNNHNSPMYTTRRPVPRKLNNNDSIFGSFIDLLFK